MSNDEYQHQDFWKAVKKQFDMMNPVCIEKGKNGECLISAHWTVLDLSKPGPEKGWFITGVNHLKNKEDEHKTI